MLLFVELHDRLKAARNAAGLTQDQVAEALGVSPKAVSGWERGESRPKRERLRKLARLYNKTDSEVLSWFEPGLSPDSTGGVNTLVTNEAKGLYINDKKDVGEDSAMSKLLEYKIAALERRVLELEIEISRLDDRIDGTLAPHPRIAGEG